MHLIALRLFPKSFLALIARREETPMGRMEFWPFSSLKPSGPMEQRTEISTLCDKNAGGMVVVVIVFLSTLPLFAAPQENRYQVWRNRPRKLGRGRNRLRRNNAG
jgi:hypothetical protein